MFWANEQPIRRRIMTAWMDGTNIKSILNVDLPVTYLTVDEQYHQLYWGDSYSIFSANLDGTNMKRLLNRFSFSGQINSLSVYKVLMQF